MCDTFCQCPVCGCAAIADGEYVVCCYSCLSASGYGQLGRVGGLSPELELMTAPLSSPLPSPLTHLSY